MRTKTTAIVLALLLGGIGAHKFYLGKPIQGAFYFLFAETGIPCVIALFEAIRYAFMSDDEFNEVYSTP